MLSDTVGGGEQFEKRFVCSEKLKNVHFFFKRTIHCGHFSLRYFLLSFKERTFSKISKKKKFDSVKKRTVKILI